MEKLLPTGRTHTKINIIILPIFIIGLYAINTQKYHYLLFLSGFLFSTLCFNPDTDIKPKKGLSLFKIFFYPYSFLFKHRSWSSHSIFFSSTLRILYLFGIIILIVFLSCFFFPYYDYNSVSERFFKFLFQNKNLFLFSFSGYFFADTIHILLDKFSSIAKFLYPK